MKKITKRFTALLLVLLIVVGSASITASGAVTQNIWVYSIYQTSVDTANRTLNTLMVLFATQFNHYNSDIKIQLLDESGNACAYGVPHTEDINKFDFYSIPEGTLGVKLDTSREYTLLIPEGAFYTDNGILGAEHKSIITGAVLCGADKIYTTKDLGISSYFAVSYSDDTVFKGKIFIDKFFYMSDPDNRTITLAKKAIVEGEPVYTWLADATVTEFNADKGYVEFSFGTEGVKINKYDSYTLFVRYASFYNDGLDVYCAESHYDLSGKKLLKLREDYPFFDFLVEWLGKDHKIIDIILTIMKYASKIKLVDSAYYDDVKKYIAAK